MGEPWSPIFTFRSAAAKQTVNDRMTMNLIGTSLVRLCVHQTLFWTICALIGCYHGVWTCLLLVPWFLLATNIVTKIVIELINDNLDDVSPNGRSVLITGCSSGFGLALALSLDAKGWKVFACCRNPDDENCSRLRSLASSRLTILKLDVRHAEQFQQTLSTVEDCLKQDKCELWAVVVNAGVELHGYLEWQSMSDIENLMNVNVLGALRTSRTFLPLLRKSHGRLIFNSSICGRNSYSHLIAYSMSKAAITFLADGLRRECSQFGIFVCTVEPARYRTSMMTKGGSQVDELWNSLTPQMQNAFGSETLWRSKELYSLFTGGAVDDVSKPLTHLEHSIVAAIPRCHYFSDSIVMLGLSNLFSYILPSEYLDGAVKQDTRFLRLVNIIYECSLNAEAEIKQVYKMIRIHSRL